MNADTPTSGTLLPSRQRSREAVTAWLLICAAHSVERARGEWDDTGIALLRCGALFSAVRISAGLVHAAAASEDREQIAGFLGRALHGGPVFVHRDGSRYYALVPPGATDLHAWHGRRHANDVEFLGLGSYLGVPRPRSDDEDDEARGAHWVVPMDEPGALCQADAVAQLVERGRFRLAGEDTGRGD